MITSRSYSPADLDRVAQFVVRVWSEVGRRGFYHLGDLSWNLFLSHARGRAPELLRLWEMPDGEIAGFAMFYPPNSLDIQSAPWLDDRCTLEAEMLEWGASLVTSDPKAINIEIYEDDARVLRLAEEHGFRKIEDYRHCMHWDLAQAIPEVLLPAGFTIRPVRDDEWDPRGDLQRTVWPWSPIRGEVYSVLKSMPGYRSEQDVVVVSPEGELASFGICWYDEVNRAAEFEPIGTDPKFRGLGLSKALITDTLHRVKAIGAETAYVYPTGGSVPAERLYTSAGFVTLKRLLSHRKEL